VHAIVQPLAGDDDAGPPLLALDAQIMVASDSEKVRLCAGYYPQVLHAPCGLWCAQDDVLQAMARIGARVGIHGFLKRIQCFPLW